MKMIKFFAFICITLISPFVFPQNQNSQEHHRQFNPQHPGYDGNSHSQPQPRPSEVWENKYGAIAYDSSSSSVWTSENQSSLRAARRDALRKCGRKTCEIVASATNGCLSAGHGISGKVLFGAGDTRELAIQDIQQRCTVMGLTCEIGYVHCNIPVRIR